MHTTAKTTLDFTVGLKVDVGEGFKGFLPEDIPVNLS